MTDPLPIPTYSLLGLGVYIVGYITGMESPLSDSYLAKIPDDDFLFNFDAFSHFFRCHSE